MIDETVQEIEEMTTQSSSVVAVKAAKALRDLNDREFHSVEEAIRSIERNSSALRQANHSHAPLYTTQKRILDAVTEAEHESVDEVKERLLEAIQNVVDEVEAGKDRAAEEAASLLDDGDVVLTHACSSTVLTTLEYALHDGKQLDLFVTESRPRFLGRRMARHFAGREGIDVTIIVDSAAGHHLADCDRVLIGMNCLIDDVVYNRVGTYPIVAAASDAGVPVTVVASSTKFIGSGFNFENNFRSPSEVLLEPPEGFGVSNPGYDTTPTRLLNAIVTEDGVIEF